MSLTMTSRRTLKAASAIREVVSMAILTELRDPRIENVTVTFVEISPDMRYAKIHVSVMGDEKQQQLCLHGLNRAAGYLQKRVNDRIDTRYTPRLQFVLDKGIKHAFKVAEILKEVLPPEPTEPPQTDDSLADEPEEASGGEFPPARQQRRDNESDED
jgi:ribosome-binding factor A